MKFIILIFGALVVIGLFVYLFTNGAYSKKDKTKSAEIIKKQNLTQNIFQDMRNQALQMSSEILGLSNLKQNEIYGVIMDWDLGKGIMTLASFKTGDASIYLSSGGGFIGGGQHSNVNNASIKFIETADSFFAEMTKTSSTPTPDKGCVLFYALTDSGIYFVQEETKNFENNLSNLQLLFNEAQEVIAEIRFSSEKHKEE